MLSVCFQIIFLHFDLEIDVLTLKMTLNHEKSIINGFPSQKIYEKEVLHFFLAVLVTKIIFDLENHIFAHLNFEFMFWPWNVL